MEKVAPGVWWLTGFPRGAINAYLVEDVLVDAGTRWATGRILRACRRRPPRQVVLTHCHPDHQGAAKAVCDQFGVGLACHEADVPAAEGRAAQVPENRWLRLGVRLWAGPPCPVTRVLRDGDEIAGFRVVHTPGHTPGHVVLFRDADRVAIAGDVVANINFLTWRPGLRQPPPFFSADPALNRTSIVRLAQLDPRLVCFGHGPPLRKPALLQRYARRFASA
jgi:glyoxylase-like metal-dependent hydrolase (beta-lactamase superfamily II)